jgi:hypothetical protein
MTDRKLARDVARQIERRRIRRRLLALTAAGILCILAIAYLRCAGGWGPGGGKGSGTRAKQAATAPVPDAGASRCDVRVDAEGIRLAGQPATRDQAVWACRAAGGADVVVTGAARQGDWDDLRAAFEAAGITVFVRGGAAPSPPDAGAP